MSKKTKTATPTTVLPKARFTDEELATRSFMSNRATTYANRRRKADRDACRGTSAGRNRFGRGE